LLPVVAAVAVPLGVGLAVWASTRVQPSHSVQSAALFVHLAALVFGFGAVLAVDWVAVLWLVGRRPLAEVLRTSRNTHLPAWLGYAALVASGALLEPDLSSWGTRLKLALVVLIGWNGIAATLMQAPLTRAADHPGRPLRVASAAERPDRRVLVASVALATLSQLGWWGAVAIGFLHTR
jgi:hypothetical protein